MRRKFKKLLAVMLALVLIISLVNVDQFFVTAGSPEAQTEAQAADSSKTEKTSQTKSEDVKSASETQSEETDQSSVDAGDSDKTDTSSSDSETKEETDSQSKTDTETADGTEEQKSEDNSAKETEEETAAAESDSQATVTDKNTSSGTDSSKKETIEDSENNKKTDVSEETSKKEEEKETSKKEETETDNQSNSQKKETTDSEENNEEQMSYEQAARKALSTMGAAEAFEEGTIADAQNYFVIVDEEGETPTGAPESFIVTTGDIADANIPSISGYDFVNATINGIEVKSVGTLHYKDKDYIYYTTEGSSTSLSAMVLGENEKINLNYALHRESYDITYEVTGDNSEINADDIFGTDKPVTVREGDSYAFRVTIPRGYEAEVLVNDASQGELGTEPTYQGNNSVISVSGEPTELTLSKTYEITKVSQAQKVTVHLTRRQNYSFSATLWTQTRYASDNGTPRADFGQKENTFNAEDARETIWTFTTKTSNTWILDGLQINGTKLNIPYGEYSRWGFSPVSQTTTLPSGTVVTLTLTNVTSDGRRTYTLAVSNCYENITITGGNLNASGWTEIIPDRLTGVEFQVYDRQQQASSYGTWKSLEQSEPFGVGNHYNNDKNYWFGTYELRFRLLPGYVNPEISYGTVSGIENNDLEGYVGNVNGPDAEGWYTFSINGQGSGNSITMLRIEADLGYYDVDYSKGNYEGNGEISLPSYDDGNYNIVNNSQIIVSNTIPTDSSNAYVFDYWTLEGYVDDDGNLIQISPNQVLNLEDVAEYANVVNGQYVLPLVAHWVDASTAEQITYSIQFIVEDENGSVIETINKGNFQAPRGSTIILDTESKEVQEFLEKNPEYVLNETDTIRYNSDIQAGAVLTVYFTKAVTDVTIEKKVTGNMGEKNKDFTFDVSIDNTDQGNVQLADGEKQSFEAVIGDTIKFKETDAQGYVTTVTYTDDDTSTPRSLNPNSDGFYTTTVTEGMYITVTNEKQVNPPSGLAGGSDSWMILLGAAAILAVTSGGFYLRRRKNGIHD